MSREYVLSEKLMPMGTVGRWDTARAILKDAHVKASIQDESPAGRATVVATWHTAGGDFWRLELTDQSSPQGCLRLVLTAVLLSQGIRGAEGMAAEWYPVTDDGDRVYSDGAVRRRRSRPTAHE